MSGVSSFDDASRLGGAARLLARLTAKSMPLMPGQGGIPSLTPQDIAAALGLAARGSVRDRIAVDVLCLRHWPEAFDGPLVRHVAEAALAAEVASTPKKPKKVSRKKQKRQQGAVAAEPIQAADVASTLQVPARVSKVQVDMSAPAVAKRVEACRRGMHALEHPRKRQLVGYVAARAHRQAQQRSAACAETEAALGARIAQEAFWEALARAVLTEYAQPNPCQVCKGRGQQLRLIDDARVPGKVRAELAVCEACVGHGTTAWSYKRRAKEVRVRAEFYRLWVNTIHEHELALLREMEREALRRFSVRLGR